MALMTLSVACICILYTTNWAGRKPYFSHVSRYLHSCGDHTVSLTCFNTEVCITRWPLGMDDYDLNDQDLDQKSLQGSDPLIFSYEMSEVLHLKCKITL